VFCLYHEASKCLVEFEVLKAIAKNVEIVLDIAPCSPYVKIRFGVTCEIQFQGKEISRARN
jgi:hypothetical protein